MVKRAGRTGLSKAEAVLSDAGLFTELSHLIEQSRQQMAAYANSTLTVLFWQIGKRINEEVLQNQRADYGKQIVSTVSTQLETHYGRNFAERNVRRMMQFAEQFQDLEIVSPLATQLNTNDNQSSPEKSLLMRLASAFSDSMILPPLAAELKSYRGWCPTGKRTEQIALSADSTPDTGIVVPLARQLSWSFQSIMPLSNTHIINRLYA